MGKSAEKMQDIWNNGGKTFAAFGQGTRELKTKRHACGGASAISVSRGAAHTVLALLNKGAEVVVA